MCKAPRGLVSRGALHMRIYHRCASTESVSRAAHRGIGVARERERERSESNCVLPGRGEISRRRTGSVVRSSPRDTAHYPTLDSLWGVGCACVSGSRGECVQAALREGLPQGSGWRPRTTQCSAPPRPRSGDGLARALSKEANDRARLAASTLTRRVETTRRPRQASRQRRGLQAGGVGDCSKGTSLCALGQIGFRAHGGAPHRHRFSSRASRRIVLCHCILDIVATRLPTRQSLPTARRRVGCAQACRKQM